LQALDFFVAANFFLRGDSTFLKGFLRNRVRRTWFLGGKSWTDRGESVAGNDSKIGGEKYATSLKFIFGRTCRGTLPRPPGYP
jgi:hypothetical protein